MAVGKYFPEFSEEDSGFRIGPQLFPVLSFDPAYYAWSDKLSDKITQHLDGTPCQWAAINVFRCGRHRVWHDNPLVISILIRNYSEVPGAKLVTIRHDISEQCCREMPGFTSDGDPESLDEARTKLVVRLVPGDAVHQAYGNEPFPFEPISDLSNPTIGQTIAIDGEGGGTLGLHVKIETQHGPIVRGLTCHHVASKGQAAIKGQGKHPSLQVHVSGRSHY